MILFTRIAHGYRLGLYMYMSCIKHESMRIILTILLTLMRDRIRSWRLMTILFAVVKLSQRFSVLVDSLGRVHTAHSRFCDNIDRIKVGFIASVYAVL